MLARISADGVLSRRAAHYAEGCKPRRVSCNVQNMLCSVDNMQRCSMQRCNMQRCNMQRCNMQPATCGVATCSQQRAACSVAACTHDPCSLLLRAAYATRRGHAASNTRHSKRATRSARRDRTETAGERSRLRRTHRCRPLSARTAVRLAVRRRVPRPRPTRELCGRAELHAELSAGVDTRMSSAELGESLRMFDKVSASGASVCAWRRIAPVPFFLLWMIRALTWR
jgi:hypothetical protein